MVSSWKSQFIYEIMWMCFVLHMNIRETKRTPYWIKNVARKNKCETKEVNNKGVNNQLEAKKLKSEWHIYSDREQPSDSVGVYFVVCIIYERCMSWSVQTQPISNLFIWTTSSSLIKLYSGFKMNVPTLCGWCGSLFVDVFVAVWLVTFFFLLHSIRTCFEWMAITLHEQFCWQNGWTVKSINLLATWNISMLLLLLLHMFNVKII